MKTLPKTTLLIAAAFVCLASASFAKTVTVTGPNGGTTVTTGSCSGGAGGRSCSTTTTVTGPKGVVKTRSRDLTTSTVDGVTTRTISGIRFNGTTFGRTTTVTR